MTKILTVLAAVWQAIKVIAENLQYKRVIQAGRNEASLEALQKSHEDAVDRRKLEAEIKQLDDAALRERASKWVRK